MKHLDFLQYIQPLRYNKKKPLIIGTDCSGIEAPIQALELLKIPYSHKFSSEINPKTRELLKLNYDPEVLYPDITTRDHSKLPKLDMYIAGFPCQAFSHLGKREGFEDYKNRGLIFFDCYETIINTDPEIFILENVKGLLTHDKGNTFDFILHYLKKLKHDIYYKVLNTLDYGLPQNRERIYIIGLKRGKFNKFVFPTPPRFSTSIEITDILEQTNEKTILTPHKKKILRDLQKYNKINLDDPWVINLNCSSYKRSSPMYNISPCLMESGAIYYITSEKRNLLPEEFLKLQGFYRFDPGNEYAKIYSVAGNSMSVPVICFLLVNIFNAKKDYKK